VSEKEELEIWEMLHYPLQKENAEKFQKAFSAQKSKNNTKRENDKRIIMPKVEVL